MCSIDNNERENLQTASYIMEQLSYGNASIMPVEAFEKLDDTISTLIRVQNNINTKNESKYP